MSFDVSGSAYDRFMGRYAQSPRRRSPISRACAKGTWSTSAAARES